MTERYQEQGFRDREEYFEHLVDTYGVSMKDVRMLAQTLGHEDDFDALPMHLELLKDAMERREG